MGFDLKSFFEALETMFRDAQDSDDVFEIRQYIEEQKEYAKQCNQLR